MLTGLFGGLLGLSYFRFSVATIMARRKNKVSLGSGDENQIQGVVSAHSNAASYIPIFLILLFLYEGHENSNKYIILALGTLFTIGRWFHFSAMTSEKMNFKNRVRGMQLTLIPIVIVSLLNIISTALILFNR